MTASAFAVESANTVGYTTRTAGAGDFIIIGTQFEDVSSTAANAVDASINDLVSGTYIPAEYDDFGDFTDTAPIIKTWVYDESASIWHYESYYYIDEAWDGTKDVIGWADFDGGLSTDPLPAGAAVWFKSDAASTITFRGNVPGAAVQLEADEGEFVFISNPMPVDFTLNDAGITWSGLTPSEYDDFGDFTDTAPIIQTWVYDESASIWHYESYYYIDGAWDGTKDVIGWADFDGGLSTDVIPAGYGFWFKSVGDATITFASPIAAANN